MPAANIYIFDNKKTKSTFPRQSLKRFTFRVKLRDSIFFLIGRDLLGLSPVIN